MLFMYFIKYLFKNNFIFFKSLWPPEGFSMKLREDIKKSPIELNLQNINIDWKLTKKEIAEVKKIKEYSNEKLKTLFDTKSKFKEFINTEYKYANENYLSSKWKTIKDLQIKLNKQLWLKLDQDNIFWKQTFLAIIKFQKENDLTVDGLVWNQTFQKLFKLKEQEEGETPSRDDEWYKWPTMLAWETNNWKEVLSDTNILVKRAIEAVKNWDRLGASDCTDFISKIWWKDVNNGSYIFKWRINRWNEGTWLIPAKYAPDNIISTIEPWDHILVDKPPYKAWKTHSIMALEKPNNWVIKVASFPGSWKPRIEFRDLDWKWRWDKDAHVARINRLS